jgi:hypothetical protein
MSHRNRLHAFALMLLVLVLLFGGCGTVLPRLVPVQAPVPQLPSEARQPEPIPLCLPSCSKGLEMLLDSWLKKPIDTASPGRHASARMTP